MFRAYLAEGATSHDASPLVLATGMHMTRSLINGPEILFHRGLRVLFIADTTRSCRYVRPSAKLFLNFASVAAPAAMFWGKNLIYVQFVAE